MEDDILSKSKFDIGDHIDNGNLHGTIIGISTNYCGYGYDFICDKCNSVFHRSHS